MKRIRSKKGETLIESLASILIFTLASIILLTLVSAANDLNRTAKETDRTFFVQMIEAEMAEGNEKTAGTVTFTLSGTSEKVAVDVYGLETGLYAYYAAEGESAG